MTRSSLMWPLVLCTLIGCASDDSDDSDGQGTMSTSDGSDRTSGADVSGADGIDVSGADVSGGDPGCSGGMPCDQDGSCCSLEGADIDLGQAAYVCVGGRYERACPEALPEEGTPCDCGGPCRYDRPCGELTTTVMWCRSGAWEPPNCP